MVAQGSKRQEAETSGPFMVKHVTNKTHFYGILLVEAIIGQARFKRWKNRLHLSVGSGMHGAGSTVCCTQCEMKMQGPLLKEKKTGKKFP